MPPAKKLKRSGPIKGTAKAESKSARPTTADLEGESEFAKLARQHWLKPAKKVKVKNEVLKSEIWDVIEKDEFAYKALLTLEGLQILERCHIMPFVASREC
jgi:intron-binding protein aquarius